jgi:hypothetical protein
MRSTNNMATCANNVEATALVSDLVKHKFIVAGEVQVLSSGQYGFSVTKLSAKEVRPFFV